MKLSAKLTAKITTRNVFSTLLQPAYLTIAVLSSLLITGIMLWSLNFNLLFYILFQAELSMLEKIDFFLYGYTSLFSNINDIFSASLVIFAVLFGINAAILTKVLRQRSLKAVPAKSSSGATAFAVLSGGCVACGTSILAPLFSSFGASTTAFFMRDLGTIFTILGSILLLYSITKLSLQIPSKAIKQTKKDTRS